ncbi:probable chitinase 10 [Lepeophtheirus salmonis]|uniref:probable chitinase 10 n=1 Tax=Lepeophtheirus salmonis TaxID=72036 RepID=UPI001AE4F55D|nr:probable chitinase 10 [Lepeophtheirus salmonis]
MRLLLISCLFLAVIGLSLSERPIKLRLSSSATRRQSSSSSSSIVGDSEPLTRSTRQLASLRTRKRIRRPPRLNDDEDEDVSEGQESRDVFSSRFAPSRGSPRREDDDDDEEEDKKPVRSRSRGGGSAFRSRGGRPSLSSKSSSRSSLAPKLTAPNDDGYKIVCYYTNWSQYRPKIGQFLPEDIDPHICTHVIFAFGWIKNGKLTSFETNDVSTDGKIGLYDRVVGLKSKNPKLKVILAIGGWSFGTSKFKKMAETRFSRQTFIFSAISFLRKHDFDGLDIDWEYPKRPDKENFVALLKELRQAFEYEHEETKNDRLILSAAVPVGPDNVRGGYDVPAVSKWLDFFNLMAYDFHGKWEKQAGHNAPLYAPSSDSEWRKQLSVSFAAQMWTKLGAPKNKMVIGMPTYGRSFTLASKRNYIVNSPSKDGGKTGEYTREAGFLAYYEICEMLLKGANYIWDDEMKVPYLVKGDQWVGFDDERSIRHKMNWIKTSGFAGAMVWSIDMDDFNGTICGSGVKYPLVGAIREELMGVPRDTVAPGIEPDDIDWETVAPNRLTPYVPEEDPQRIDIADLLGQVSKGNKKNRLPALLQNANTLPENLREPQIFCYFTNWSYKRPGMGKFTPEDLDPKLCTHIVFAFATISNNKLTASEDRDIGDAFTEGTYDRIMLLKEQNPDLQILLALGGWSFGSEPFRKITENIFRMNGFVYDSIEFLRRYNFDGLDIDWEYPENEDDKAAFVNLIKELRLAFEGEHKSAKKPKLLLTAAVPANYKAISAGYDVPELSKYLDFLNVMTYDFHGQWENEVGHNSPLFPLNSASNKEKKLTVDYAVKEWVRKGAPLEKINVGMPVYGRTFKLKDNAKFDIGAEAVSGGDAGRYTGEEGFLSYYEICDFLHQDNTTLVWDNEQQVPFAYRGDQWVGFDDERSLRTKVDWLKTEGFGGIMIWSVDLDDFRGYCGTGKFPLIKAMKKELQDYAVELKYEGPYETPRAGEEPEEEKQVCDEDEGHVSFHRDKNDCKMYFVCQGTVQHHKTCPSGLVFNENENVCDWPSAVEECAHLLPEK